jgi:hypothetical protein
LPDIKLTISAKLGPFFTASAEIKPTSSAKTEMKDLTYLLDQHTALYQFYEFELAGRVANSIRELRGRLGRFPAKSDHVRETAAMFRAACADFQAKIEFCSGKFTGDPMAIYEDNIGLLQLEPLMYQLEFVEALGQLRATVRILLVAIIERYGLSLPPKLVDLVNS